MANLYELQGAMLQIEYIIGIYNGIVVTGSGMMPTYRWLYSIYNSYRTLRHTFNLVESRNSNSGSEYGARYSVHNSIVVARAT